MMGSNVVRWRLLLVVILLLSALPLSVGCAGPAGSPAATSALPATSTPEPTMRPTARTPEPTETSTAVPVTPTPSEPTPVVGLSPEELANVEGEGDGWEVGDGAVELVAIPDAPGFEQALRLTTLEEPPRVHDLRIVVPAEAEIARDDVLWLHFYARAAEVNPLEPAAYVKVYFQDIYPILHPMRPLDKVVPVGTEWQEVALPFVASTDYEMGAAAVYLGFGFSPQAVEVGGLELLNYGAAADPSMLEATSAYDGYRWGTISYAGRESDAAWRAEAEARIEEVRKGDLTIRVQDAAGNPIDGAEIAVEMTRHAYGFGSAVAAYWLTHGSADGDAYRAVVEEHYNKIVFENDLKYGPWEEGKTTSPGDYFVRANTFEALEWLTARDIAIRGHTLIWGPIRAGGYNQDFDFVNEPEAARDAILAHLEERLSETQPHVNEWDVINHPVATFGDRGNRLDLVYGKELYLEAMARARAAHPDLIAYVNEGEILTGAGKDANAYEAFVQYLFDNGQPPDGIGFMGHFEEGGLTTPVVLLERLDRFAKFGVPLQVTEFDIDTTDVKTQADYLRDFMTAVFSHPASEGIILWGFWEGQHWRPEAALYEEDWTLKPNGQMWLNLVKDRWWTDEAGATDDAGLYETRGFLGEYKITVKVGETERVVPLTLLREGTEIVVTLE
ncbi:MAG: endo-1,4-beta-xylanase [Anaerolineae bacterium]